MAGKEHDAESNMQQYSETYMEKVFYFCLKKTGNPQEAEDLASEISLCILTALQKGIDPVSFSGYVWQIARNRYSRWADQKRKRTGSVVSGTDIAELALIDGTTVDAEYEQNERLSLLHRELAFISTEYRSIVLSYYIENQKIKDIAETLHLTESAVKTRLFRARNILKEGMNMAREFGIRSYQPEEISFINNCSSFGEKGQPWSILSHALYKNIFLEVYGNPETAEELSLELGVALAYMEDELRFLTEQTFLTKNGNKYETAFPIISRDAQQKIHKRNHNITKETTGLLESLIDQFNALCKKYGIHYYGTYQNYEDAKWTLLMRTFDRISAEKAEAQEKMQYATRPDHGCWDIVGYQSADLPIPPYVGLNGCLDGSSGGSSVYFQQFKFRHEHICDKTPECITQEEAVALKKVTEGSAAACEDRLIKKLLDYGYIRKESTGYVPNIVVFNSSRIDLIKFSDTERACLTSSVNRIKELLAEVSEYSRHVITEDLPPNIQKNSRLCRIACENSGFDRNYVLEQALQDGWLKYDPNTSPVIGAYLYI